MAKKAERPQPNGLFPHYKFKDLKDYILDPTDYFAGKGFLRKAAGTLLIGPTGMGKSVLAEQFAVCLATGKPLLNKIAVPNPKRVLYIESENDLDVLQRDICSIAKRLKAPEALLQRNLDIRHIFGVTGKKFGEYLEEDCNTFKPEFVVIDHYQSYVDGDLNNSTTFTEWIKPINMIIQTYQISLLIIAHKPKPRDTSEWDIREGVYSAMGNSVISNWARTSCELSPMKYDLRRFKLTFSKNADRTGLRNMDGSLLYNLFVEHSTDIDHPFWEVCANQTSDTKADMEGSVQTVVDEHPEWTMRQIAEHLGCTKSMVGRYYPKDEKGRKEKPNAGRK